MRTLQANRTRLLAAILAVVVLSGCADERYAAPPQAEEQHDEHAEGAGDSVESGRIELSEVALRNADITVADVVERDVANTSGISAAPAQVEFDPARVTLISPRASGRIERLAAVEGDAVHAGQPVAFLLSPQFLTAQNDFVQAVRRAARLAGTADEQGAAALAEAARRRLALLGAGDELIERLAATGAPLDLLPIAAPSSGSIVKTHTLAGASVDAGSPIFTLADLTAMNVVADVPERSLPQLRRGQSALVELAAYPDERITGTVDRIREELDPATRTAKAVIRVTNPRRILRPGMFATVRFAGSGAAARVPQPVIPVSAVITDGSERYVFVEVGLRTYERRAVVVEPLSETEMVVHSGLTPGERVVIRGAFTLKSELAKGDFGEHEH